MWAFNFQHAIAHRRLVSSSLKVQSEHLNTVSQWKALRQILSVMRAKRRQFRVTGSLFMQLYNYGLNTSYTTLCLLKKGALYGILLSPPPQLLLQVLLYMLPSSEDSFSWTNMWRMLFCLTTGSQWVMYGRVRLWCFMDGKRISGWL